LGAVFAAVRRRALFRLAVELFYNAAVAKRLAVVKEFRAVHGSDFDRTVRTIIEGAKAYGAVVRSRSA
jgi:allophanate hydrolase